MIKNQNKKKSTTKKGKFSTSKLIPVIAIVEVLVLIAISTFAWYFLFSNKKMSSGIVTVNADSGLDIDFKDADKNSYLNIFDYIDEDEFFFEPASSVDGRNIYFPTSGTFNETNTSNMVFREGTVNDINAKYIDIDFTLTNTDSSKIDVFLSNNSFFRIKDNKHNKDEVVSGKALRLALYNNDGNSGDVSSHIVSNFHKNTSESAEPTGNTTIYFTKYSDWGDGTPRIYLWNDASDKAHKDDESVPIKCLSEWDNRDSMQHVTGNLYSFTFNNPEAAADKYDKVLFTLGSQKTDDLDVDSSTPWYDQSTWKAAPELATIYFLCPSNTDSNHSWVKSAPKCAVGETCDNESELTESKTFVVGGDTMTKVTEGVYSYTFPNNYNFVQFLSGDLTKKTLIPDTANLVNKNLYYVSAGWDTDSATLSRTDYSSSSVYFYNAQNWEEPYVALHSFITDSSTFDNTYRLPLTNLSGGLYYTTVPAPFLNDFITKKSVSGGAASNCTLYFYDNKNTDKRTSATDSNHAAVYTKSEYIYTPTSSMDASSYYVLQPPESYSEVLNYSDDSFAVISPGVSAGFQRPANPVNTITASTGAVTSIIPTFASSFDDFIMGSDNPVFSLEPYQTVNMSMIIWLEGTDEHCTAEKYAANNINLYLEFSTEKAGDMADDVYNYQFIDATLETWTGDRTKSGNTWINPVMQLYDVTNDRGYLMKALTYSNGKVKTWQCQAPQSLITDSGKNKHEIQFRRVNPYNESEVWNYWDAGYANDYINYARVGSGKAAIVSFTAFADGSPESSAYTNGSIDGHKLPEKSCGGLWGAFSSTEVLNVYDGRMDNLIIDDTQKASGNGNALNFGYTYQYGNGVEATIEYKASPTSRQFFEIVVPSTIFTKAKDSYFVHYSKLKDYAINAPENDSIRISQYWKAGNVLGLFYEFNEAYDFDNNRNTDPVESSGVVTSSYWGSDMIYVQVKYGVGNDFNAYTGNNYMKFYKEGTDKSFLSRLYENDQIKDNGNGDKTGFGAVVPCGSSADYDHFQIYRTKSRTDSTIIRQQENPYEITTVSDSRAGSIRWNKVTGDNLVTVNWDYCKFWYKNSINNSNYNAPKNIHYINVYNESEVDNNTLEGPDSYGNFYKLTRSDYKFEFKFEDGGDKFTPYYNVYDSDGKHYDTGYWWDSDQKRHLGVYDASAGGNVTDNINIGCSYYYTDWTKYTAKEVKS